MQGKDRKKTVKRPKRIKASHLQWKGYTYISEELENCEDTMDLFNEYGTRLDDGTVNSDDAVDNDEADNYHGFQIKRAGEVVKWDD